jgi:cytochrome c-type biogenesis protein CcmH
VRFLAVAAAALALALAAPAAASEQHPTLAEVESEVICPVCNPETLDQSNSAIAQRMKEFIKQRIAAGDTKSEIEAKLVANFGESILAEPPKKGFNLLAWVLPFVGVGLGAVMLAALAWRWSRSRPRNEPREPLEPKLDPELERRVDEALARFDG